MPWFITGSCNSLPPQNNKNPSNQTRYRKQIIDQHKNHTALSTERRTTLEMSRSDQKPAVPKSTITPGRVHSDCTFRQVLQHVFLNVIKLESNKLSVCSRRLERVVLTRWSSRMESSSLWCGWQQNEARTRTPPALWGRNSWRIFTSASAADCAVCPKYADGTEFICLWQAMWHAWDLFHAPSILRSLPHRLMGRNFELQHSATNPNCNYLYLINFQLVINWFLIFITLNEP